MKSSTNEGIQGSIIAEMVVVGRGARATKTVHSEAKGRNVLAVNLKVFISYRRADSAGIVGRIYDRLTAELGSNSVFRDIDSIPFGVNFLDHLASVLRDCTVMLVVIGRDWLTVRSPSGVRRLDDPGDVVRSEIEYGLQRKLLVVPLLVDGAVMPSADQLPLDLQPLATCNGTAIRLDPDFHTDMGRLIRRINSTVAGGTF